MMTDEDKGWDTDEDFPPLQFTARQAKHNWKIRGKAVQQPDGTKTIESSPIEQTLNWQSENATAQNQLLKQIAGSQQTILAKIDDQRQNHDSVIQQLQQKIQFLHEELIKLASSPGSYSTLLIQKESEMRNLKEQLNFVMSPHFGQFNQPLGSTLPIMPQPITSTNGPYNTDAFLRPELLNPKPKQKQKLSSRTIATFTDNHLLTFLESMTSPEPQPLPEPQSSILPIHMANEEASSSGVIHDDDEVENVSPVLPDHIQTFTLDNAPPHQWRDKFLEFHSWLTAVQLDQKYPLPQLFQVFASRMQGRLRDYWIALGEYRQLMYYNSESIDQFLGRLHQEFLGAAPDVIAQARREFMQMKCVSFKRKHLQEHFDKMSKKYYQIQGIDEVSLKYVFLQSFPEPLGQQAEIVLKNQAITTQNASLGALYQAVVSALDRLCEQRTFFKQFNKLKLGPSCSRPDLVTGKPEFKKFRKFGRSKKFHSKVRYFKWKNSKGKRKGDRCFICKQKGHFAKQCLKRSAHQALLDQFCGQDDDLESLFEDKGDQPSPDSIFCIRDDNNLESSESETLQFSEIDQEDLYMMQSSPEFPEIFQSQPVIIPLTKATLLTSKYDQPIKVIAFFDTGASSSMINPAILPTTHWQKTHKVFRTVSGEIMVVNRISKPVIFRPFPGCEVRHKFYGSKGPARDVLVGFDLFHKLLKLKVRLDLDGLHWKSHFHPWTQIPNLFTCTDHLTNYADQIIQTSCADSHTQFLAKCSHPLWTNLNFFISLLFEKSEEINPTKATHFGMHPDHQKLAEEELALLKTQGLIEDTSSPWACQAFYVNKHSEQVRGKLRLVIDYKPLNLFLADDKFPLPCQEVLLQKLPMAKIFSKFDLKAGFWQLGICAAERYKTSFCIPNFHYQWTVMPFGLKNAPSEFQKAMTKIFEPLLSSALIYIDDILLFSENIEDHLSLLQQFHKLVLDYGVMLSEKKNDCGPALN